MTDKISSAEPYKLLLDYLEQGEKTMVQCRRGGELTRVPETYTDSLSIGNRIPVYYGNSAQLILVPKEEITLLGFN